MRVAIVHHWFVTRGGGERVAECIASLFPHAELFSLLVDTPGIPEGLRQRKINTSFLQRLPLARKFHRHLMPLYPAATESLDLRGFDLVLSSDSGPVKGVRIDRNAVHICYCHSPMRYLWDEYESYREGMNPITRAAFTATAARVKQWDIRAAERVTWFVANSAYVACRIAGSYGRESTVIHPPIDLHRAPLSVERGTHYLCAGRLVGYKKTELMMEACRRLGRELRIAGTGPEEAKLRQMAGFGMTFLGALNTDALWQEYAACRALLFAADEDFGMVPLEAQACGTPVVAYGAGGSLETVCGLFSRFPEHGCEEDYTGMYFPQQTVESLMEGMLRFEAAEAAGVFHAEKIQGWAARFDTPVFLRQMHEFVLQRLPQAAEVMLPLEQIESGLR